MKILENLMNEIEEKNKETMINIREQIFSDAITLCKRANKRMQSQLKDNKEIIALMSLINARETLRIFMQTELQKEIYNKVLKIVKILNEDK